MFYRITVRGSDKALARFSESTAGHQRDLFGIKKLFAKFVTRHTGAFYRRECVKRAFVDSSSRHIPTIMSWNRSMLSGQDAEL